MLDDKKTQIKESARQLREGVPPDEGEDRFPSVFEGTDALEIANIEEELYKGGIMLEDMPRQCDPHTPIFRVQIEKQNLNLRPSQPMSFLMDKRKIMARMTKDLAMGDFQDSEKHLLSEENVLFPMLDWQL